MSAEALLQRQQDALLSREPMDLGRFVIIGDMIRETAIRYEDERNKEGHAKSMATWMEWGIAGIDAEEEYRAEIHLNGNDIDEEWIEENGDLEVRYDYDSLLGRTSSLPYAAALEVYPLFGSGYKLKKRLHIGTQRFQLQPRRTPSVEEYQIPHLILGHASERRSTFYLMLPALINWDHMTERNVSSAIMREAYDKCLYPAVIQTVHHGERGHWLPTWNAEMERARGERGRLQISGRLIPADCVWNFGRKFMQFVRQQEWGKEAYFFHEVRGSRGATQHEFDDRESKLTQYLSILHEDRISAEDWWIDVAMEVQKEGWVIWTRTDAHQSILAEILKTNQLSATAITRGSGFKVDHPCHLEHVSGFRLRVPARHRERSKIAYIQIYETEKEAMYHLSDKGNSIVLSYNDVLLPDRSTSQLPTFQRFGRRLLKIWTDCKFNMNGHARIEVRMNLKAVRERGFREPLINLDLTGWFCAIPREEWWSFKVLRLSTMICAIQWWTDAERGKTGAGSISLMISLCYMLNSLCSRPRDLPAERDIVYSLLSEIVPRPLHDTPSDDSDMELNEHMETRPPNPFGVLFPSSVIIDPHLTPAPQVGRPSYLTESIYARLFQGRTLLGLQLAIESPNGRTRRQTKQLTINRVNHQKRLPPSHIIYRRVAQEEIHIVVPDNAGIADGTRIDDTINVSAQELTYTVTNIFQRCFVQMMACSPNAKRASEPAYCKLTKEQRDNVTHETFQEPNLAMIWGKCTIKIQGSEGSDWETCFNYLFPDRYDERRTKAQNYRRCPFFLEWTALIKNLSVESTREIRDILKRKWDTLCWMPCARTDRIWETRSVTAGAVTFKDTCYTYPSGATGPAPVLVLNPKWEGEPVHFEPRGTSAIE